MKEVLERAFKLVKMDMSIPLRLMEEGPLPKEEIVGGDEATDSLLFILKGWHYVREENGIIHLNIDLKELAKERLRERLEWTEEQDEKIRTMIEEIG